MNGYGLLVFNDVHLLWCRKLKIYTHMWMGFYVLMENVCIAVEINDRV